MPGSRALNTDFYQLTMAAAYFEHGMNGSATFSLFTHDLPAERGFMLAAGLEVALDYLQTFAFAPEDLDYLASLNRFSDDFLHMLSGLKFSGGVRALPEGTVCFGGEPLLEVSAPLIEAQLVETFLINVINLHSTLASKAARCVLAAKGRTCVDFSLRRTHGLDAGFAAARSSSIAGFTGTSNVDAARILDTNPVGTMAHAFVEAFGDELDAFRAFAKSFPDHTVLLVDTYDSVAGLERAVEVAQELAQGGHKLVGVRLDSGDLVGMSRQARRLLDSSGLEAALVVVSGSLDEHKIAQLVAEGAQVDVFGVGTRMGSSADAPYLDFAYKLVDYDGRPTLKLSAGKETWAGAKQVWRSLGRDGRIEQEVMGLAGEEQEGRPLLQPVMADGKSLIEPDWRQARQLAQDEMLTLPAAALSLDNPRPVRLSVTPALKQLQEKVRAEALARQ